MGEPLALADVAMTVVNAIEGMSDPGRHEVVRLGKRAPIKPVVRALVHKRDGNRCHACGRVGQRYPGNPNPLQIDHIVPWSAGGTDRSDNLRTLCSFCNEQRSNFRGVLDDSRRPVGVTRICVPCAATKYGDLSAAREVPADLQTAVYCGTCHMTSWTHAEDVL